MTKHWPEQGLLVLTSLSHLGEHHDHQLDSPRKAQQSASLRGVARCTAGRHWTQQPAQMVPQQPPRLEKADAHPGHLFNATATMDKPVAPGSSHPYPQNDARKQLSSDKWSREQEKSSTGGGKKKNYQRYPKPPYSYLAMIAMVIQRSPEKKLTLSEVRIFSTGALRRAIILRVIICNRLVFYAYWRCFSWLIFTVCFFFQRFYNNFVIKRSSTRYLSKRDFNTFLRKHCCS